MTLYVEEIEVTRAGGWGWLTMEHFTGDQTYKFEVDEDDEDEEGEPDKLEHSLPMYLSGVADWNGELSTCFPND
jgi:hypothetical protein